MKYEVYILNDLQFLGITPNYRGYRQAAWAVQLALEDEERLCDLAKNIYKPIAQLFFCYPTTRSSSTSPTSAIWKTRSATPLAWRAPPSA